MYEGFRPRLMRRSSCGRIARSLFMPEVALYSDWMWCSENVNEFVLKLLKFYWTLWPTSLQASSHLLCFSSEKWMICTWTAWCFSYFGGIMHKRYLTSSPGIGTYSPSMLAMKVCCKQDKRKANRNLLTQKYAQKCHHHLCEALKSHVPFHG